MLIITYKQKETITIPPIFIEINDIIIVKKT